MVCGYFNNHMPIMRRHLIIQVFTAVFSHHTLTYKEGGQLDQLFTRNIEITNAVVGEGIPDDVTDHMCLMVTMSLKERTAPMLLPLN